MVKRTKVEVSVIIATYNSKKLLLECIESLEKQDFPNDKYEVIIVDDGSTDGTIDAIKKRKWKIKVKTARQNRKGPATARNTGAKMAEGKYIGFTDADCAVPKDWMRHLIKTYKKYPEVAGIGGPLEPCKKNLVAGIEKLKNKYLHKMGKKDLIGKEEVPVGFTNNMSYKTSIFKKLKGFDESFSKPAGEDFELKQRACQQGYLFLYTNNPIIHMEPYDLDYFLRQILKRGTEKRLTKMSNIQMIGEVVSNLPAIISTLSRKTTKYRKTYN